MEENIQSTEDWQIANENKKSELNESKLTTYWNNRYLQGGNSGAGSYGQEAQMKASLINHWIKEHEIRTIQELGCGDANNLLLYDVPISYCGYDISPKAVEICNEKTKKIRNSLKYYFTTNMNDIDYHADLCLCLDVWYHLVDDQDFEDFCQLLFNAGQWKYIIIYSTDSNSQVLPDGTPLAPHVRYREVQSKIAEYPQWKILYWVSGYNTPDNQPHQFPSDKRFFLLERV